MPEVSMEQFPAKDPFATASGSANARPMAITSLVIGVFNLCAWVLPICGIPLGMLGVVFGYFGLKEPEVKTLAMIGIALSAIGLILACVNSFFGALISTNDIQQLLQGIG